MPFIARCSFCGCKARVPDDWLGNSVTCPKCSNSYTAAPWDPAQKRTPPAKVAPVDVAARLPAPAEQVEAAQAETTATSRPLFPGLSGWSATSLLLAGLSLLFVSLAWLSLLSILLTCVGLGLASVSFFKAQGPHQMSLMWPAFGGMANVAALCATIMFRPPSDPQPLGRTLWQTPTELAFPCGQRKPVPGNTTEWIDASKEAAQFGGVFVTVASVVSDFAKTGNRTKAGLTKEKCLVVQLQFLTQAKGTQVRYHRLGDKTLNDTAPLPRLVNYHNQSYVPRFIAMGKQATEPFAGTETDAGTVTDDMLLFELPRGNVEFLRLELPAAAFGGTGTIRFHIPKSLIAL